MDWDCITALSPDNLTDEEKDDLFNKVTWFDCDTEAFEQMEIVSLFKLAQEILKYKSIQVETLLSELDEIAAQQGEHEAKKLSDSEAQSLPSKRSGSIDLEELESKYSNLKVKYRKLLKALDKLNADVKELRHKNKLLEQDRMHLQNELQQQPNDNESSSDVSELVKDQQKELIDNLHRKNVHISKLLDDIESVEKDNINLREKLTSIKDELEEGTNQLNLTTSELTTYRLKVAEMQELASSLRDENEALKIKEQDMLEEKAERERQIDEYSHQIESRVDKWKKIIDFKDKELHDLRSKLHTEQQIVKSSSNSSISEDNQNIETEVLQKVLAERENQISLLKSEIQSAVDEMDSTTTSLTKLKNVRDLYRKKNDDLMNLVKDLKVQLRGVHSRCQELQQLLSFAEDAAISKETDLKSLIDQIRDNGNIELADILTENADVKTGILAKEKQIADLVRTANKLQKCSDRYSEENIVLRMRLGLSTDDHVGVKSSKFDRKTSKSSDAKADRLNLISNDEKLQYRLDIERLTKSVSNLANQVINLGEKPNAEYTNATDEAKDNYSNESVVDGKQYVKVVEENEALRKGLHEILNSVQENATDNLKEIKSQTLEQLLLALDAKHISGWYHPAMRLQAELHTIQGVNSELREQLRNAKLELEEHRKNALHISGENKSIIDELTENSNSDIIQYLKNHIFEILNNFKTEEEKSCEIIKKLEEYRDDFLVIQKQLSILYKQYSEEKEQWLKSSKDEEAQMNEIKDKLEITENKLSTALTLTNGNITEHDKLKKTLELSESFTISNRKCLYLQDEEVKYKNEIAKLRNNILSLGKIEIQPNINKIKSFEATDNQNPLRIQKEMDDLLIKYRDLLDKYESSNENNRKESDILNSIIDSQKKEKQQVMDKLFEALNKLNSFENSYCSVDKGIENLTRKLAQCEINEITEKQRADHTNNLYELVKDQLKNSEDKLKEKDTSSEELKKLNLALQEQLKDSHDKIMYFVDVDIYKEAQANVLQLQKKVSVISDELTETKLTLKLTKAKLKSINLWSTADEYMYLNLKHQIVDLQAVSDDKAIIARLSSEVVSARLSEAEIQKKFNALLTDFKEARDELLECLESRKLDVHKYENLIKAITRKNEILEEIVRNLRQEYYGFVPLSAQSRFIENVHNAFKQKHKILETLQKTQIEQQCCLILKEQLAKEIENIEELKVAKEHKGKYSPLINWYHERNNLQLQEIKYKRQSEYMDHQLKQAMERIKDQDNHILKLEEEHIQLLNNPEELLSKITYSPPQSPKNSSITISSESTISKAKILKCSETQTYLEASVTEDAEYENNLNVSLQKELSGAQIELENKETIIEEQKSRIKELEVNVNLFRTQLGDKQSQITFYEKHIVELQAKKEKINEDPSVTIVVDGDNNQEQVTVQPENDLKNTLQEKDEIILNLQTLLKKDRDEHSLAAARMQNELKRLYDIVNLKKTDESQSKKVYFEEEGTPKAIIEQYILQVHALEKHTVELHTTVSTLTVQLQASREEAVRWRALANDRLEIMEQFGKEYDKKMVSRDTMTEQHKEEIDNYKKDGDKWRQEVVTLQQVINKHKEAFYDMKAEVEKHRIEDKDTRIHELTLKLRQQQSELRKKIAISADEKKFEEQEMAKEQLFKEHETLKKRFEQLMNRERNGREELHSLRAQLMKRPLLSARSDSSTLSNQQSQRKIKTLLDEINILQEKLQQQNAIIDSHRSKVSSDFEKWSKQKHFQQMSEKLKQKLKEKQSECEKLQETVSGFRIIIERSEREKYNLEARIKNLKTQTGTTVNVQRFEVLAMENAKLLEEHDALKAKLSAQQHHSGALGAAMLQEKLEAQERKIAVMEVAAKGTLEVRLELERLGNSLNSVQRSNLRLEAENLELKLDAERNAGEIPHLKEQIIHLENYLTALKTELNDNQTSHQVTSSGDHQTATTSPAPAPPMSQAKKIAELERTAFVLKRIVEKLQADNKRLISGSRPCSDRSDLASSTDRYRRDYYTLKELHTSTSRRIAELQDKLTAAHETIKHLQQSNNGQATIRRGSTGSGARSHSSSQPQSGGGCDTCFHMQAELNRVNEQLAHKADLLDKVKVLLQKAAAKEKGLLHEVANLKSLIPTSPTKDAQQRK